MKATNAGAHYDYVVSHQTKKGALRPPRKTEMVQGRLVAHNNDCSGLALLL
jgi:hypothetical protein